MHEERRREGRGGERRRGEGTGRTAEGERGEEVRRRQGRGGAAEGREGRGGGRRARSHVSWLSGVLPCCSIRCIHTAQGGDAALVAIEACTER